MKLTAPSKKVKNTLSKVSTNKVTKKREKDGLIKGKSKEALESMLGFASESLPTPEKKIVAKSLKKKQPAVDSPVAKVSLKKSSKASKKNVAESPVVAKSLKAKKKVVQKSPVVSKSAVKDLVEQSPVATKSLKTKKKKNVANSPVVAKSLKKMKAVDTTVKTISKEEPVEEPAVVSVSLQKPTKASKKVAKSATTAEPLSTIKGVKSMKKAKGKKSTAAVTAVKLAKKASLNVIPEVPLDDKLLQGVCAATLKLVNSFQEGQEKKDLFGSLGQPINLQLNLFKVPQTPQRIVRCAVPNSIYPTDPDVLLILPDIKRGRFRDVTFAQYLQQYEEKLSEAGITGIKQIIPYTQLRAEYSQFELKRRLVKSFDVLLCDARVEGPCCHFLGSALMKANKTLTPIRAIMSDIVPSEKGGIREIKFNPDLQKHVDAANLKVVLKLQAKGTTCSIVIGHSQFSGKQLADNVRTVWSFLAKELPGGVKNIQSALLKGTKTLPVPLYASLIPPKEVPVVQPKAPGPVVEDELSTVPGFTAVVDSFGNIQLKNNQTPADLKFVNDILLKKAPLKRSKRSQGGSDSKRVKEEAESDESESEDFNEEVAAIPEEAADDLGDSDSDFNDEIANAAEEAYLNDWAESADLEDQENQTKSKSSKKGKNKGPKNQTAQKKITVQNGKQPAKKKASKKSPAFIGIQN